MAVSNGKDRPSIVNDLPPEILGAIFDMVILPSCLCDPTTAGQPNSTWKPEMLQKLRLLSVSKAWYLAARSYLYEEIVINEAGQATRLLDGLDQNQSLGPLVRRFVLSCYVEQEDDDDTKELEARLLELFSKLPNLTSVSYAPWRCLMRRTGSRSLGGALAVRLLSPCAATITQLWLSSPVKWEQLTEILGLVSHRLVSFRFLGAYNHLDDTIASTPIDTPFCFPVLETLFMDIDKRSLFARALTRWEMPVLKRLTVSGGTGRDGIRVDSLRMLSKIIKNWPTIQYLNVNDGARTTEKGPVIASIIYQLPLLEHLVCQPFYFPCFQKPHPRLRWIDVYLETMKMAAWLGASLDRKLFPRFQGVRVFSPQLIRLLTLPFTFHPSVLPAQGCTWSFSAGDVCFDYTSDGIHPKRL